MTGNEPPSPCAPSSGYGTQEGSEASAPLASPSSFLFSSSLASPRHPASSVTTLLPLDLSPKRTQRSDGRKAGKRAGKRLQHSASLVTPSTIIQESASMVMHSGGEGSPEPGLLEGRRGGSGVEGSEEVVGKDVEGHKVHRRRKKEKEGRSKGHRREEEEGRRSDKGEEGSSPSNATNNESGFGREQLRHSHAQQQQQQLAAPHHTEVVLTPSPKSRNGPRISIKLSDNGRCVRMRVFLSTSWLACVPAACMPVDLPLWFVLLAGGDTTGRCALLVSEDIEHTVSYTPLFNLGKKL